MPQLEFFSCCLADEARAKILEESKRCFPCETGGMLVGRVNDKGVQILCVTGPGPQAQHSEHEFRRDGEYSQNVLDELVDNAQGEYDYIGEWHSHPANVGPSAKDFQSLRWIAQNNKYAVTNPILGICRKRTGNIWSLEFYVLRGRSVFKLRSKRT